LTVDEGPANSGHKDFVRKAARMLRTVETLDVRLCRDDPHLLAIHDLAVRYQERATAVQMRRWVEGMRLWMFGAVQQMTDRAQGPTFDVDDEPFARIDLDVQPELGHARQDRPGPARFPCSTADSGWDLTVGRDLSARLTGKSRQTVNPCQFPAPWAAPDRR
jgi:hypothetical protein